MGKFGAQLKRFIGVGFVANSFNLSCFYVFTEWLAFNSLYSVIVLHFFSTAMSYFFNKEYTFSDAKVSKKSFLIFQLVNISALCIQLFIITVGNAVGVTPPALSYAFGIGLSTITNFYFSKKIVFSV